MTMTLADLITGHRPGDARIRRPFLIAEAGVNHEGSIDIARRLVDEAAEAGADAIKFQTYKADTIASRDSPAYWDLSHEPTTSQHELFSRFDSLGRREYEQLKRRCDDVGIEFLSTPFDTASAAFLKDLVSTFKIASADITSLPFIEYVCALGRPLLLSTGASTMAEIGEAVGTIEAAGNRFGLMHCILNYPTAARDANLGMLLDLRRGFPQALPGYSDHTLPDPDWTVLTTAVLFGAAIVEKHFTHDKSLPGNDHYHAMDTSDLRAFRAHLDEVLAIVGEQEKSPIPSEEPARRNARRSLVAARPIAGGSVIVADDITWKRPAHGISPRHYREVLGRTARLPIDADAVLQWSMLE